MTDTTPRMDNAPIEIVNEVRVPVPPEEGGGVIEHTPPPKFYIKRERRLKHWLIVLMIGIE